MISWGLGLVFGFGLNLINIIPFYYLFIPTWVFTIIVYTVLAGRLGARGNFEAEEKEEAEYQQKLKEYHAAQAKEDYVEKRPTRPLTKLIRLGALAALVVLLILASTVLFGSPDIATYEARREVFYTYGFLCTLTYFVLAIWAYNRAKPERKVTS